MLSFICLLKGFILLKVFLIIELLRSERLPIVHMQLMLNCFDIGKTAFNFAIGPMGMLPFLLMFLLFVVCCKFLRFSFQF
jgi:hypothetical protein